MFPRLAGVLPLPTPPPTCTWVPSSFLVRGAALGSHHAQPVSTKWLPSGWQGPHGHHGRRGFLQQAGNHRRPCALPRVHTHTDYLVHARGSGRLAAAFAWGIPPCKEWGDRTPWLARAASSCSISTTVSAQEGGLSGGSWCGERAGCQGPAELAAEISGPMSRPQRLPSAPYG